MFAPPWCLAVSVWTQRKAERKKKKKNFLERL
jgi:hypothetical protein